MKKLIVAFLAMGTAMALRPVVKRRMVRKMREHCKQMMAEFTGASEATGPQAMGPKMREHCDEMAAQREERSEPVATV